jgi:deoxycytidylate deaminase
MIEDLLRRLAKKSPIRCKHAAIVLKNNNIVATGYNDSGPSYDRNIHAEISALKKIGNLKGCVLKVIRLNLKTNEFTNSRPCSKCMKVIEKLIKNKTLIKVEWSN